MREEATLATEKRKLGTLPAEECGGCALAPSLRLHHCGYGSLGGMGDKYNPVNGKENKYVADAVGIRIQDKWTPLFERREPDNPYERVETIYCIEVKVSRNDFKSGCCIGGNLNYVMIPKGLVAKDEVYKGIGLIKVDLNNLEFTSGGLK